MKMKKKKLIESCARRMDLAMEHAVKADDYSNFALHRTQNNKNLNIFYENRKHQIN